MKKYFRLLKNISFLYFSVVCVAGGICGCASQLQYFPVGSPTQKDGLEPFYVDWFSKYLKAMQEPSLIAATNNHFALTYRLTILPTWENPVAVRVEMDGEKAELYARRLAGAGGDAPGKLEESSVRDVNPADTRRLRSLLKALNLFHLSVADDEAGNDGVRWVLEGVSEGKYHVITRWAPDSSRTKERNLVSLVEFAEFVITHSGLSKPPVIAKSER
jgi:hypothetical protein